MSVVQTNCSSAIKQQSHMFEGVFIYAHVVLGFSVYGMFKHMYKGRLDCVDVRQGAGMRPEEHVKLLCGNSSRKKDFNEKNERTRRLSLFLLFVFSISYFFSLWLIFLHVRFGALTWNVFQSFVYLCLIFCVVDFFEYIV